MGAENFYEVSIEKDIDVAFNSAREGVLYWVGHQGYSGTIAEKDSYLVYLKDMVIPLEKAFTIEEALLMSWNDITDELVELVGELDAILMASVYNDKWGPCVAFRLDDGSWFFCGLASS